ncbi:MAG: RluA family pseudouridine synthase [Ahrensia sp.]|nr:RluA family pseudouridine synthase [Ahrensia sp.]
MAVADRLLDFGKKAREFGWTEIQFAVKRAMTPDPELFRDTRLPPVMVYAPPADPIELIYRDESILIVDKPEGLLSVPAKFAAQNDCLASRLHIDFPTATIVHRLDMDTSGIMVVSLTDQAKRHLGRQFEQKRAQKTYVALVEGIVSGDEGEIDLPLTSDKDNLPKQMVCFETGRPSQTKWRVLERLNNMTRLELTPLTGRTHQLRVHLKVCGHPIVGDRFYGARDAGEPRMMLHANWLKFRLPTTNQFVEFSCPCPF